jgi:hypothetical protein
MLPRDTLSQPVNHSRQLKRKGCALRMNIGASNVRVPAGSELQGAMPAPQMCTGDKRTCNWRFQHATLWWPRSVP